MTWKQFVYNFIRDFCDQRGSRTFTLHDLESAIVPALQVFAPNNHHREAKLRQILQYLRDDNLITFVDGRGTYTLRGVEILKDEVENPDLVKILPKEPQKREYLIEVFARQKGWVKMAREAFGFYCMVPKCSNTFLKEDGLPYCEVHHIVFLCEHGEDALWNLCVLCAHHHRMAHFAAQQKQKELRNLLLQQSHRILNEQGYNLPRI